MEHLNPSMEFFRSRLRLLHLTWSKSRESEERKASRLKRLEVSHRGKLVKLFRVRCDTSVLQLRIYWLNTKSLEEMSMMWKEKRKAERNRSEISLNPNSNTIYSGLELLTWHTEDKHEIVLFSTLPGAPQSFPISARTQQLTRHSPAHRCHHSLFVMLFGSDLILLDRLCPSCE